MPPLVSLVVPALASDRTLAATLIASIPADPRLEILLVEAGHVPGLEALVGARPDVRTLHSSPGRARQMNAGAELAAGDWLVFVHADSHMPRGWLDAFASTIAPRVMGGWFRFALDHPAWQARVIERGVALRVLLWKLPYGDQGLFVRRPLFASMGGYRDIPLMEDVDFIRRLAERGPLVEVPCAIATSARRWLREGWFRRSARNLALLTMYFWGVPPERLARWY